jgi:hypothetical protein
MRRGASSAEIERENASCACFDAVYGPDAPTAIVPATDAIVTTSDGAARSSPGRNARSDHTDPR